MPAENARLGAESDPHDAIGNKELIELLIGQRHAARARRDCPAARKINHLRISKPRSDRRLVSDVLQQPFCRKLAADTRSFGFAVNQTAYG